MDPDGRDYWSTNDKDEIERILAQIRTDGIESLDKSSFGSSWTRVRDKDMVNGIGVFDDIFLSYTIDGTSYEDFNGFGKNVGYDYLASLGGIGLEAQGGTFTMFLQQSLDKNKFLRQNFFSLAYSDRAMSTSISASKLRLNLNSLGKGIGAMGFAYTFFDSALGYRTGRFSAEDVFFNIGLGSVSLKWPIFGITYGVVEFLHPGGWRGWRESMNNLTNYADERFLYGPKL